MCIYKEQKNVDRFAFAIQFVIFLCVGHLKSIQTTLKDPNASTEKESEKEDDAESNLWTQEETERMLQFVAKVKQNKNIFIFTILNGHLHSQCRYKFDLVFPRSFYVKYYW